MLHEWALHDLGHIRQVAELVRGRKYLAGAGPLGEEYKLKTRSSEISSEQCGWRERSPRIHGTTLGLFAFTRGRRVRASWLDHLEVRQGPGAGGVKLGRLAEPRRAEPIHAR